MRKLTFLLIPLFFLAAPLVSQGDEQAAVVKPAVYGVLMYADWCGACKALDPKINQARKDANLDNQEVLFLRWDLTNETTQHQALMMASALGLSDVYAANAGKTGFMLLLDAESGKRLAMLTVKQDSEEIASEIKNSIKTANS